jgi:hypothetical protein
MYFYFNAKLFFFVELVIQAIRAAAFISPLQRYRNRFGEVITCPKVSLLLELRSRVVFTEIGSSFFLLGGASRI